MRRHVHTARMGRSVNAFNTLVEKKTNETINAYIKPNTEARSPGHCAVESSKY